MIKPIYSQEIELLLLDRGPISYNYTDYLIFSMQKDNNGIVMVNFYSDFINCTDPAAATVGQVAGKLFSNTAYV